MGNSLQEQLLKAGLVDEKKLKQTQKQKGKQNKRQRHGEAAAPDPQLEQRQRERAAKAERDRELNRQRQETADRKAIRAQILQLIETHRLSREGGETAFHFTEQGKIKRIYVTDEQQQALSKGKLVVVALKQGHELVPAEIGERILERNPEWKVSRYEEVSADKTDDDYYAKFEVPDDLMW